MFKKETRIVGFDDGPFEKKDRSVPVIGVIFRGGDFLDGVLRTDIKVDGLDASEKIIKLINQSRHKQQLKIIMFDGVTLGGFNVLDIKKIFEETGLPVIVINRKIPNLKEVKAALKNFKDFKRRWKAILNAGEIKECKLNEKKVYYQCLGLEDEEAEEIIRLSSTRSFIPEALRVAHLIATAVVKGESFGRA